MEKPCHSMKRATTENIQNISANYTSQWNLNSIYWWTDTELVFGHRYWIRFRDLLICLTMKFDQIFLPSIIFQVPKNWFKQVFGFFQFPLSRTSIKNSSKMHVLTQLQIPKITT